MDKCVHQKCTCGNACEDICYGYELCDVWDADKNFYTKSEAEYCNKICVIIAVISVILKLKKTSVLKPKHRDKYCDCYGRGIGFDIDSQDTDQLKRDLEALQSTMSCYNMRIEGIMEAVMRIFLTQQMKKKFTKQSLVQSLKEFLKECLKQSSNISKKQPLEEFLEECLKQSMKKSEKQFLDKVARPKKPSKKW